MSYSNPCQIFQIERIAELREQLRSYRSVVLVSTKGCKTRGQIKSVVTAMDVKTETQILDVSPNPQLRDVESLCASLPQFQSDVAVLAIGGGSALDFAKGAATLLALRPAERNLGAIMSSGKLPATPLDLIAVPTTAGTGSEVTCWGTIWDGSRKLSLSNPALYPKYALLWAELTLQLPAEHTLATGLDALSHAFESILNRNTNLVSQTLALEAISVIMATLPALMADLENLELREKQLSAACLAGLAFSNTQTAICHSMSYPLTGHLGLPHGFACSFSLPEVVGLTFDQYPEQFHDLKRVLRVRNGDEARSKLYDWFQSVSLADFLGSYREGIRNIDRLDDAFINPSRAKNSLLQIGDDQARAILKKSAERICQQ